MRFLTVLWEVANRARGRRPRETAHEVLLRNMNALFACRIAPGLPRLGHFRDGLSEVDTLCFPTDHVVVAWRVLPDLVIQVDRGADVIFALVWSVIDSPVMQLCEKIPLLIHIREVWVDDSFIPQIICKKLKGFAITVEKDLTFDLLQIMHVREGFGKSTAGNRTQNFLFDREMVRAADVEVYDLRARLDFAFDKFLLSEPFLLFFFDPSIFVVQLNLHVGVESLKESHIGLDFFLEVNIHSYFLVKIPLHRVERRLEAFLKFSDALPPLAL